jgi:hypothetical protein
VKLTATSNLRDRWTLDNERYLENWKEGIAQQWKENDEIAQVNDTVNEDRVMYWLKRRPVPAVVPSPSSSAEHLAKNEQTRRRYRGVKMPVTVERPPLLSRVRPAKARSDTAESVFRSRSIWTRLTELLQALIAYIKQLLKKLKSEGLRPAPILPMG